MRIYQHFDEAFNEVKRDLKEMGVDVHPKTVHDKKITDLDAYATKELMNYGYVVTDCDRSTIPTPNATWLEAEWRDRLAGINGVGDMIGTSFDTRSDDQIVWTDMLEVGGKPINFGESPLELGIQRREPVAFSYSYAERLAVNMQVWEVIKRLRVDPESRQMYVSIWDARIDSGRFGQRRIPCSLGYHFLFRAGKLHVTYTMRSCELGTHFYNDVWFACAMRDFIAEQCDMTPGSFTHFINSFHCYKKNLQGVF